MTHNGHQPVLLEEVIEALSIKPDGFYVDGTFGRGGHSRAILEKLNKNGRLFVLDKDPAAIKEAVHLNDNRMEAVQASFAEMQELIKARNQLGKVDGILLDLGVSSPQLEEAERGFSFLKEGPLDMRMNPGQKLNAEIWLKKASVSEIARVLKEYGEERFAKRIATAIVNAREIGEIKTTLQLAEIVAKANPRWEKNKHPATRSFQAIRIFINHELEELEIFLKACLEILSIGGRIAIISFHSLEDRMVKRFIQQESQHRYPADFPIRESQEHCRLKKINSLIRSSEEEIRKNPRARSACLRIAEKIA